MSQGVAVFAAQDSATGAERIASGIDWLLSKQLPYRPGRMAFTNHEQKSGTMFSTLENAMIVSVFVIHFRAYSSNYLSSHLKANLDFIRDAQAPTLDFYEYYDSKLGWSTSGRLYFWNAYVLDALTYASTYMRLRNLSPAENTYYDDIISISERTVEKWRPTSQSSDGAWVFSYPSGLETKNLDADGKILAALIRLAFYEQNWGNPEKAREYLVLAEMAANWLLAQQERNHDSLLNGAFYDNAGRYSADVERNARAMYGLLAYWENVLSVTKNPSPSIEAIRSSFVSWADDFLPHVMDPYFGPYRYVSVDRWIEYPKRTITACLLMRDAIDIWVDHGADEYKKLVSQVYGWLAGRNELHRDLQNLDKDSSNYGTFAQAIAFGPNVTGEPDITTNAECVFSLIYARLIDIPEMRIVSSSSSSLLALSIASREETYTSDIISETAEENASMSS